MLEDAKTIGRGEGEWYTVSDDRICYKYMDGLTSNTCVGYQTLFAYKKEHELGVISDDSLKKNLGMLSSCGAISYAELPVCFDFILGVTGTLKGLSDSELNILKKVYDVSKFTFIPSAFGRSRLVFSDDSEEGKSGEAPYGS